MKKLILKVMKLLLICYVAYATWVGTAFLLKTYNIIIYNSMAPAPMPVWIPNGFSYSPDWGAPGVANHITYRDSHDGHGEEVIKSDVRKVMWHDDWIYGYRRGHAGEIYYFICQYGNDCSASQSYKDIEFDRLLKEYGLPEFTSWDSKGYDELLREQDAKGINTGYGG